MAGVKIPQQTAQRNKRVFFKVKIGEKYTEYSAIHWELEIWGKTVGTKDNIKDVVRRIILARKGVTYGVDKAAIGLANYIASMASFDPGSRAIWGGAEVALGSGDTLELAVGLYYVTDYDSGDSWWRGEVEAVFYGNDGLVGDAVHKVVRRIDFREVVDVARLYRELVRVARHALNASSY
jgi:hypothetical protein